MSSFNFKYRYWLSFFNLLLTNCTFSVFNKKSNNALFRWHFNIKITLAKVTQWLFKTVLNKLCIIDWFLYLYGLSGRRGEHRHGGGTRLRYHLQFGLNPHARTAGVLGPPAPRAAREGPLGAGGRAGGGGTARLAGRVLDQVLQVRPSRPPRRDRDVDHRLPGEQTSGDGLEAGFPLG